MLILNIFGILHKVKTMNSLFLKGFLFIVAAFAILISKKIEIISPLIISIILGAIIGNIFTTFTSKLINSGIVSIATKQILRIGIVLYGFKITLSDIISVGFSGIFVAGFVVFSTFIIGFFAGKRLGLDKTSIVLISSGSAVCGAAAVLAASSVCKSDSSKIAVAICTVVVFGTALMFIYPILFGFTTMGLNADQIGIMIGASLHEVAHVAAAGIAIGDQTAQMAIIIKMLRVLMLIPFLFIISFMFTTGNKDNSKLGPIFNSIPWFAFGFLGAIIIGSMSFFPKSVIPQIDLVDTFLLCVAMSALGLSIRPDILSSAGIKPFLLASILLIWLIFNGYFLAKFIF